MGALGRFRLREGHQETSSALSNDMAAKEFVAMIGQAEGSVLFGTESSDSFGMGKSTAIRLYLSCHQLR